MEGSKQAQPGTVALFWVEKLRGASFPVPFCRWWVLRLLTGDLSQQLKSQEFLRLVYIYCQKKMWYFNWHSSLRFCLTWLSKAGQLPWIWGHRAVVKHEQWTSGQSVHEDREGEMGNRKGKEGHTAVVLPGFYMTGRAMRFCWVLWDGGAESMKWIFYLAMVTLHF